MIEDKEVLKKKVIETLEIYRMTPDLVGQFLAELEDLWEDTSEYKDFLGSPEVQLTVSTANRWINIYKAFCDSAGYLIKDIVFNKAKKSWIYKTFFERDTEGNLKSTINKEDLDEWVAKAKTLSQTDWSIEKKQFENPITENHEHTWNEKKQWDCECGEKSWLNPTQ